MSSLGLADTLWSILYVGWLLVGLYVYVALIRQISMRTSLTGDTTTKRFGAPEALVAALIMLVLLTLLIISSPPSAAELKTQELIENFLLVGVVVFVIAA